MDDVVLTFLALALLSAILVTVTLYVIRSLQKNKIQKHLNKLEFEKNQLSSVPIDPELEKIKEFLKNESIEIMYKGWKERLEDIRKNQIPKVNDLLIDTNYGLKNLSKKDVLPKLVLLEMELYKVRENSQSLLSEIKSITTSEEKNRNIITKLKVTYRELLTKFTKTKIEYGKVAETITIQFENINKRFEDFEKSMEDKDFAEVTKIIKAIDDMLKHMAVVIEEVPTIQLIGTSILPKKIKEALEVYDYMVKNNYPLHYLAVEDNVKEANKKIEDILDRAKMLNLEDSLFELKILMEYFDDLFEDFEKEKQERYNYEEISKVFANRLNKMNLMLKDIFSQIDDIKTVYNLSTNDLMLLGEVDEDVRKLNEDYKLLTGHTENNAFAYSHLTREIELLTRRLIAIEERLDNSLDAIGSMKEDELRAREQLEEIKNILREANRRMRIFNFPTIPQHYKVELTEANQGVQEIIKELEKKPITISVLNTRVDTARDLALKLVNSTNNLIKYARYAENLIVYGNRFRSAYKDVDKYLTFAENLFENGNYVKSLEVSLGGLKKIDSGIEERIAKLYKEDK
jgi:septation ring formation regulator